MYLAKNAVFEIKGLPGEILNKLLTGGPFYIMLSISRVGCVTILPDNKQGRSPHL